LLPAFHKEFRGTVYRTRQTALRVGRVFSAEVIVIGAVLEGP
jgi:hypothetical protein